MEISLHRIYKQNIREQRTCTPRLLENFLSNVTRHKFANTRTLFEKTLALYPESNSNSEPWRHI